MTPEEYRDFEENQLAIIAEAQAILTRARALAQRCKPPKDELRPAVAADIAQGQIVWHDNGDEGWFWNIVVEPRHYGDPFKAYVADDGCRYGLEGAWVRKQV